VFIVLVVEIYAHNQTPLWFMILQMINPVVLLKIAVELCSVKIIVVPLVMYLIQASQPQQVLARKKLKLIIKLKK